MSKEQRLKQVRIITQTDYRNAKHSDTGEFTKESVATFEDFINFEISVIFDNGHDIESITPTHTDDSITIIITYTHNF